MAVARILLVLALAALAPACTLDDDTESHDAGIAVKTVLEQEYLGFYGAAWDTLHPRHQRLVGRNEYDECRRSIDVEGTLESVVVLAVRDADLTVYGLPRNTPAKRVEVRVTTDESQYTARYHVVDVGGRWRWVLTDEAARGFERSDCPA